MCEELLIEVFKTKLKIMNSVVAVLPTPIKEQAANFQKSLCRALHEVTKEEAEEKTPCKSEKGLKSIDID